MRTDAFILSTEPTRESDLLVRCYTEQAGSLIAVARGALPERSVQGRHLDQGNLVRFDLVAAHGMPLITGGMAVSVFSGIKRDLAHQAAAWTLLEVIGALVMGTEADPPLWGALSRCMAALDACERAVILPVLRNGQRDILGILGYAPRMGDCGICGTSAAGLGRHRMFSVQLGSLICATCASRGWHGIAMSEEDCQWLAGHRNEAACTARSVKAPTELLIEYVAGRPLRSLDLLFSALRA